MQNKKIKKNSLYERLNTEYPLSEEVIFLIYVI